MSCPDKSALIDIEIRRVLTQYRESPKLLHMIRTYLGQVVDVLLSICVLPDHFYLETAVGDQLTLLGQRLGWPRCHCVCSVQPIFGFNCEGVPSHFTLVGFCDGNVTWADCGPFESSDICLNDDETYRKFLKVRRYQALSMYDPESLEEAIQIFFGPTASVISHGRGRVVIAPGRPLSESEQSLIQLYPRVLPVAPGVNAYFHYGTPKVFGFGEGWGTFCEHWQDEASLTSGDGVELVTEDGETIDTGELFKDAPWMCEIDPQPYDCAA